VRLHAERSVRPAVLKFTAQAAARPRMQALARCSANLVQAIHELLQRVAPEFVLGWRTQTPGRARGRLFSREKM